MFQDSSLFNVVLGMAASLLALSILIQIIQEFYKFLFKSKSAAYRKVLFDLIGSQASALFEAPETADYRVRGPWDMLRRGPAGILLPLAKEQLGEALERTAPNWVTRILEQIKLEKSGDASKPDLTTWNAFLKRLGDTEKGAIGYRTARELTDLLKDFGHECADGDNELGVITPKKPVDMAKLETAVRKKFLPHVEKATKDFDLLEKNLEFSYKRRNLRQTFVIGFLVAFVMGLPAQTIHEHAKALTEDQVTEIASKVVEIYETRQADTSQQDAGTEAAAQQAVEDAKEIAALATFKRPPDETAVAEGEIQEDTTPLPIFTKIFWKKEGFVGWLFYILGCIATAILLSFGAPFWNDIAKSILNYKKSMVRPSGPATTSPAGTNT